MNEPTDDQKGWEVVGAGIDIMYTVSGMVYDQFVELVATNPIAAAVQMREFIDRARNIHSGEISQGYLEAISGGPNPDYMLPIINLVGRDYPDFPDEIKRTVLDALSDTYAGVNFQYVRWLHTPKISSPEILRDFCLEHDLFFPDLSVVDELITRYESLDELVAHSGISELTVAMWLTRPLTKIKEEVVQKAQAWRTQVDETRPDLMKGALKVLGALDYQEAVRRAEKQGEELETLLNRMSKRVDEIYQALWREAIQERVVS